VGAGFHLKENNLMWWILLAVAAAAGAGYALWRKNQSATSQAKPKRAKTIDEMNELELADHLKVMVGAITSLDGMVVGAVRELGLRGREVTRLAEEVRSTNQAQPGNVEALQAAIDAYEAADQAYSDQLARINGTDSKPGLTQQVADARTAFNRVKRAIDDRQGEFTAGKAAILRTQINLGDASIATVTSSLEVKPDASLDQLRKMRAAAEMEAQLLRGDKDRAEEYRRSARTKVLLDHLGIGPGGSGGTQAVKG
jgi:hypothetical protein